MIYVSFWLYSLQPLASEAVLLELQMYNDTQAAESLHLLEHICTVSLWLGYKSYITACKNVLH